MWLTHNFCDRIYSCWKKHILTLRIMKPLLSQSTRSTESPQSSNPNLNVGTMCITSGAVLKAQRYQLEKKATEERAKNQKKNETPNKRLLDAQSVKEIYKQWGEDKWRADETSYYVCSTGSRMH